MKKKLFIVFLIAFIIIFPNQVNAIEIADSYISINNPEEIKQGKLLIKNIKFNDYSNNSTLSYGITGTVNNSSDSDIKYEIFVSYFDKDYTELVKIAKVEVAMIGDNNFNFMQNDSVLKSRGYKVSDIAYFKIELFEKEYVKATTSNSLIYSSHDIYKNYDYVIDKYDVNIIVNENNTLDITETITAYFNVPKHGIFRTIPLRNTITRLDGTTSNNRTQITNVSVDNEYTTSRENGNYKLKIGSASRTLTGEQTYVIKYTYNLGKDPAKDYDELYYNIIGNEWDTVIGNITFSITMPKEFDSSKLGFSSGSKGSTDNSKVKYNVRGNIITGSYSNILGVGEALTIRCELPEGYFVGAGLTFNLMNYIIYLLPILFLVISLLLWYKFGRDDQVVETVEFYPPQGFNSLEVGFLYKGKAGNQDVISLLIYLANQGYIKISETEEKSLFSKSKGFKITKLKEYEGNNINEKLFLNGLFTKKSKVYYDFNKIKEIKNQAKQNGEKISANEAFIRYNQMLNNAEETNINTVTSTDLYDNFYTTMGKILLNMNTKENKNKIFEKSVSNKTIFIILMIIATYCLITIPPVLTYAEVDMLIFALLLPGIGFTIMFIILFGTTEQVPIGVKLFSIILSGSFGGILWALMVLPSLRQDPIYLIGYILGFICVLGMIICLKYLSKRTTYGNEMLGKLKGFKNFLETAEKEKLEALVMQDSTYFYNILPFTYVLGVSDKWIKKFESMSLQAPSWYDSPNAFDMVAFGSFMNNTMTSAQSAMSSSPSSGSGSDGSSGGGSSGGGSGGGGGGSW